MLQSVKRSGLQCEDGSVSTDGTCRSLIHSLEVASINTLPQEILCEIFALVHDDNNRPTSSSVVLSHICKRWREVVLDLPRLWVDVRITQYDHEVLKLILQRSKGRPLNISVYLPDPTPNNATFSLWKTVIMLTPEMKRCHTLNISAVKSVYKMICNAFGPDVEAPLLRRLTLHCLDTDSFQGECMLMRPVAFNGSVLTHIDVNGVAIPSVDLSRVTTLVLKNISTQWLPNYFPSENVLERLHLSSNDIVPWRSHGMVAPRLAHITLDRQGPFSFCDSRWITPALTSLTISRPSAADLGDLKLYLRHPQSPQKLANLKALTLAHCDTRKMAELLNINALMLATPELTRLNFEDAHPEPVLEVYGACSEGWPRLMDVYAGGVKLDDWRTTGVRWKTSKDVPITFLMTMLGATMRHR